jgi:CheY-like chemotaxis protein
MKKILIVDDQEINRTLLREIIEDYQKEKKLDLSIDEAENGAEAVALFKQNSYDLILMDITMPIMNGIEATRRIREISTKPLIIVVSAQNDMQSQKSILDAGAEDYISKPVNVDIFLARLGNYLTLIKSRKPYIPQHDSINLYSSLIYTRKISFYIGCDNDLAEFWEYFLLNPHVTYHNICSITRAMYDIGLHSLEIGVQPMIWIEESDEYIYLTMKGLSELNSDLIHTVMTKDSEVIDFKIEKDKFSIRAERQSLGHDLIAMEKTINEEPKVIESKPILPIVDENEIITASVDVNQIYNYMDLEDLENIHDHLSRLHSLLLMVGSGDITHHEVEEISYNLDRIGRSASMYSESYPIARALSSLSVAINKNIELFIEKSSSLGLFCKTFGLDLMNWLQKIFYEGAPSFNFMDDTIVSNAQMLESMLVVPDSADEATAMDDIFDF